MTRRRRLSTVSRVCIGAVLLLLAGNITADTIKGPPTILEKTEGDAITEKNRTILTKVSDQAEFILSSGNNDKNVAQIDENFKKSHSNVTLETEQANAENTTDENSEKIRSHDEVERSSTSNTSNVAPKFDDLHYGTSGKSSSTKAISEDFYRLSRTNGLTTVTTKPALEETASRLEEKRGKVTANPTHHETKTNTSQQVEVQNEQDNDTSSNGTPAKLESKDPTKSKEEKRDKSIRADTQSAPFSNLIASLNLETSDVAKEEKRESITSRDFADENDRKKNSAGDVGSKNLEVFDLEKTEEQVNEKEGAISLINDTNVNYKQRDKTLTDKSLEPKSGNRSLSSENGTNFILEDSTMTHEKQDPKEEVEVVKNVTHTPILKIVESGEAKSQTATTTTKEAEFDVKMNRRESSNEHVVDKPGEWINVTSKITENTNVLGEKRQNVTTRSNETRDEEERIVSQNNTSPIPRGRTIGFSGANEFPSHLTKTTASFAKEIDAPLSKKNISTDKTLEQKPYPYLKSTKEPVTDSSPRSNDRAETTEESSAYENTIGRGESERKIIVTEPSVVIENSIQQFKPTYHDRTRNGSSNNSSAKSESSVSTTTTSLADVKPTNGTYIEKSFNERKTIEGTSKEDTKLSEENDVPRGNAGSKEITGKDENFDVTGNGITEVSLKLESPESADKAVSYVPSFQQGDISNNNVTTEVSAITKSNAKPQVENKLSSSMDVQTDAEESLLIRSTLNVTEVSTQYPLTRENFTENDKSSMLSNVSLTTFPTSALESTTMIVPVTIASNITEESSTVNIAVESGTSDANGTNEIPSGSIAATPNPEEIPLTTTTSVEFEFVGLTEATVFPDENTTEREDSGSQEHANTTERMITTFVSTVQDLNIKNYTVEDVTVAITPETVTDNSSLTEETEISGISDKLTTTPMADQTMLSTSSLTMEPKEGTSTSPTIDVKIDQNFTKYADIENTTRSMTDSSSTVTTEEDVLITSNTEESFVPLVTKDSRLVSNVSESSSTSTAMNSTSISNVTATTDSKKTTTAIPFTTSSLYPRIFVSSTWSTPSTSVDVPTERTTEGTTDVIQTLSSDEIISLVRIVMKGTLHDVCPNLETLRVALAEILKSGMNTSVYPKQIIFHQNPCLASPSPAPTPTDVPLTSILVYVVDENGKFDSTMTNILPSLYNASPINFPVAIHSFLVVQETDSGNAIAVIVVSSVAFICLILLAGLLFIMRKRQTRFNYGERCRPVSLDAYSLDSVSANNSVRRKGIARSSKRSYGNPTFEDSSAIPSHPLNFAGLSSFCNDVNAINEEFSGIPQVSAKIDELPPGAEVKNRYANVIPLPETRVPLQKVNNDPLTEYINASYVRGAKNATRYYIACQGPMENTVTDFWRMIWEQQCKVIIMLTDLVENGVEKCTEYIPPSEVTDCHRLYGDFQVTLKKRETKEKYAISTLHLKNLENNTFREVYHIWYLWPVNGVQSDGAGLIAVLLEARALQRGGPGPIVVHCSPGTGRTGTLIALDLGIRQYEITRTVDVPRVVYTIRRDRAGAVQTKEQYAFIYKALNLYATKLAGGVLEST